MTDYYLTWRISLKEVDMSCDCENKKVMSEQSRVSGLARKAAMLDRQIYAVFLRSDGTYGFGRCNTPDVTGKIVEYRHYM